MSEDAPSTDDTDADADQDQDADARTTMTPKTADGSVNYWALEPPDQTPPTQYTADERRADLLGKLVKGGTPHSLNQSKTAKIYGVSQPTISKDVAKLADFVGETLGNQVGLTIQTLFEKTVRDLRDEGEYKEAWDVAMDWSEWLANVGAIEYEPERVEVGTYDANDESGYQVVRPDSVPDDFVDADFEDVTDDGSAEDEDQGENVPDVTDDGFTATPGSGSDGTDAIDTVDE